MKAADTWRFATILVALLLFVLAASAQTPSQAERVQLRNGTVLAWQNGRANEATNLVSLPFGILVQTNGAFTVNAGKERRLQEGDILNSEGMLQSPDGSITAVMDHLEASRGRVLVFKSGESSELREPLRLGDNSTVYPDGSLTTATGSRHRILDGELLKIGGGAFPARDSITLRNGHVMVQKDGSMIRVDPEQSIMMNDGTKVFGNGTVTKTNGERVTLTEGQIFIIEGVATRAR